MTREPALSLPRDALLSPRALYQAPSGRYCRYVPYARHENTDQAQFVYVDSPAEPPSVLSEFSFNFTRANWRLLKVVSP